MECVARIADTLSSMGIPVNPLKVDKKQYLNFLAEAEYRGKYPDYYIDNFYEKTVEHFLCYNFLDLKPGDRFVDIASEHSPIKDIFCALIDCTGYSQDIMYEPGIHGSKIGGNAANLPFSDSSFKAAIATCSIEHFKNELRYSLYEGNGTNTG